MVINELPVGSIVRLGRYALGLLWYCALTGNSISNNTFNDFDADVSIDEIEIAKNCVKNLYSNKK